MSDDVNTELPTGRWRIGYWASAAIAAGWVLVLLWLTIAQAFRPYVAETDWKQAVWQYWRYNIDGAFPPGHLLTDCAFVTHAPPVWWAMMASLSSIFPPMWAANILNIIAFLGAAIAMYFLVRKFANPWVALVAAVMVPRMPMYFYIASGGYARSFGQTLVLTFLALWAYGKHRWVLAVLIIQAGLYPSVVVPCGLSYGLFLTYRAVRHKEFRAFLEVSATGVVVIIVGLIFDWRSPDWWGPMVTPEEAWKMPALQSGGRAKWVPMTPIGSLLRATLTNPFRPNGSVPLAGLVSWQAKNSYLLLTGPVILMGLYTLVGVIRRKMKFPVQILLVYGGAFCGYILAREMAFQLYLPRRVLQHSYGVLTIATTAILLHLTFTTLMKKTMAKNRQLVFALTAIAFVVPIILLGGFGMRAHKYRSYAKDAKLYEWVQKNTDLQAQFAGNYRIMDEIPLFSQRQVYMNWKLAHPWRAGFYKEVEKRTLKMYTAYYATEWKTVLDFADAEKIDYFIIDKKLYEKLEKGDGQLFRGIRSQVAPMFSCCKDKHVFKRPPPEAVVFKHNYYRVIDIKKLRAWYGEEEKAKARAAAEPAHDLDAGPSGTDGGE